jgi:SAM-dependent methyltransferase
MPTFTQGKDYTGFKTVFHCGSRPLGNLNTLIHDEDEMLLHIFHVHGDNPDQAAQVYFTQGFGMFNLVRQILEWKFGDMDRVSSFLDFACGYGRFTRFMAAVMPPERIWASDIYAAGVEFLTGQLGVNGIVSTADPGDYVCGQRFDCIFVASLFSHLPEETFVRWLQKLHTLLNPGGVLLFSVNDEATLPDCYAMPDGGFLFIPQSESRSLDKNQYGSSWVSERFVRKAIGRICGDGNAAFRLPRGLLDLQDLYILPSENGTDFSTLKVHPGFLGCVDRCIVTGSKTLELSGWAANLSCGTIACEIQIWINGALRQQCVPCLERPDVAHHYNRAEFLLTGWQCSCPWAGDADEWIVVKVCGDSQIEQVIRAGRISCFTGVAT